MRRGTRTTARPAGPARSTRPAGPGVGLGVGPGAGPGTQRGLSTIGVLAIMGVAVFLGLFAIKAGPVYFENLTVKKIVADTVADEDLMRSSRSKVYEQLNAQYGMNNLWGLKAEDTVELKRDGDRGYVARVNYEKRETLFANIDLVMRFDQPLGDE